MSPTTHVITPPELIPARMLNEFAYCPRLCYLEWVQQEWEENECTLDGTFQHRRVDRPGGKLPDAEETEALEQEAIHARSVILSAAQHGLIAKMDLIEAEAGKVIPVEYKRGSVPDNPERSWEPERVQLCAQVLILRENGYTCQTGIVYYVQSRQRVEIPIDDALVTRTEALTENLRGVVRMDVIPPPLQDSPKCPACSLVGICLPDEVWYSAAHPSTEAGEDTIRRLYPARDDALPLYVQEQGAYISKSNEELVVKKQGSKVADIRLIDLSHVCIYGNAQISTQAIQELLKRTIPILFFSYGGWFNGICRGMPHKNVDLRRHQYRAESGKEALEIARILVLNKIQNSRILLRRNSTKENDDTYEELRHVEDQVQKANCLETLLGFEGNAARIYFQSFSKMLKIKETSNTISDFDFTTRNRRPPRDPINALLSFAYSLLVKDFTIALLMVGFDPYLGFYHQPRYGRPALALDMMEPFRPLIADSVVVSSVNNGVIQSNDFIRSGGAVALKPEARKRFIQAYERRMDTLITHPVFNYRISYRRVLEVQSRLLARFLMGELSSPPEFNTR